MSIELFVELHFSAAHWLPEVPEAHRCRRLHGHTYSVRVSVTGEVDPELGWVMDFGDIRSAVSPLVDQLDHRCLNDIPGLENPTSELLATWFAERISRKLPGLATVTVREGSTGGCTWTAAGLEREGRPDQS